MKIGPDNYQEWACQLCSLCKARQQSRKGLRNKTFSDYYTFFLSGLQ